MFKNKDYIAVLNFCATKIEASIVEKIVNDNIKIIASSKVDYAGFFDGEFLDEENIGQAIYDAFNNLLENFGKKIDNLYIGVPAEFCNYMIKNLKSNYINKVIIKKKHIEELFENVQAEIEVEDYQIISKSPIYYVLDDGVQVSNPIDNFTKNLGVKSSIILAKNGFIDTLLSALSSFKLKNISFIPVPLALSTTMLDDKVRQNGTIIVDFDYVSTSVMSVVGDGIIDLKTFAMGEGHIVADIAEVLKLNYFDVEKLKSELVLTLDANPMDTYEILDKDGEVFRVNAHSSNEVVKARLNAIAEIINKLLFSFQFKQDRSLPIYLTGAGIVNLKGATNILSRVLNRKCELLIPNQVEYRNPKFAEKIGVINFVFDIQSK